MKTLDEVIEAWTICFSDNSRSNCTGCPYADEDGEAACFNHDREDALHYLKMYRSDKAQYEIDRKQWETAGKDAREAYEKARDKHIAKLKELDIGTLNNPLSWDELRTMEGKPVWVELFGSGFGEWDLCHAQLDDRIWFTDGNGLIFDLSEETLGKTWQAYRKELS